MSEIKVGQRGQIGARYYVTIERYRTVTEKATVIVDGAQTPQEAESWACEAGENPKRGDLEWNLGGEQVSECVAIRATQVSDMAIIKKRDDVGRTVHVPGKSED